MSVLQHEWREPIVIDAGGGGESGGCLSLWPGRALEMKIRPRAVRREWDRGWVQADQDVAIAAWDWEDGNHRTIYLLNIDWWSAQTQHPATLRVGSSAWPVSARRGRVEVITIAGEVAVMTKDVTMDVIAVEPARQGVGVRVQSDRGGSLRAFDSRTGACVDASIPGGGVQEQLIRLG